jgi:hypothetical protein
MTRVVRSCFARNGSQPFRPSRLSPSCAVVVSTLRSPKSRNAKTVSIGEIEGIRPLPHLWVANMITRPKITDQAMGTLDRAALRSQPDVSLLSEIARFPRSVIGNAR